MRPSGLEPFGSQRSEHEAPRPWSQDAPMSSHSASSTRRLRPEDSWVDVSSIPSSSSLSSAADVRPRLSDERLSREFRIALPPSLGEPRSTSATGSSQDEYEESESESDQVLSSSNEDISQEECIEDDDRTALGIGRSQKAFTPQPNAFSHPPSSQNRSAPGSYFPSVQSRARESERTVTQRSYERQMHSGSRAMRSSHQQDHDAALRASLTTLLSCAAAVRPKGSERNTGNRPSVQPTTLRMVPESALSSPRAKATTLPKQTKRKSRESSKDRSAKKIRAVKTTAINEELISPTLATWMISAGVVLAFSAISFSAGYAWGKEVGRVEGEMGIASSCSKEALKGSVKRLRWTSTSPSIQT